MPINLTTRIRLDWERLDFDRHVASFDTLEFEVAPAPELNHRGRNTYYAQISKAGEFVGRSPFFESTSRVHRWVEERCSRRARMVGSHA